MRQARFLCAGFGALLAGWVSSAGCTHNYYYGYPSTVNGCPPTVVPGAISYGSVCDVPTQVVGGGSIVAQSPSRETVVNGTAKPPQVVVSEPGGGSRTRWRRSDPDSSLATTRVEGALEDPTVTK